MRIRRLIVKLSLLVVILASFGVPSHVSIQAQSDSVTANVVGINTDNKVYTGKLTVTKNGAVYDFSWNVGSKYTGVGIFSKDNKTISVGIGGAKCSIAAYEIKDNGTLDGQWIPLGGKQLGSEVGSPTKVQNGSIDGDYELAGTNPDSSAYKAKLTVTKHDSVYQFSYDTGKGTYEGVGVLVGNVVSVGWGDQSCSVATYTVTPDGSINGLWGTYGVNTVGLEQASLSIDGNYKVTGNNVDSSPYNGALRIKQHGPVYQFLWNVGAVYEGIGIRQADTVSVAWGDKECTILSFKQFSDGLLYGLWGTYGKDKIGAEVAQLTGDSPDGVSGQYMIEGIQPEGKKYSGSLKIEPQGDLYSFTWEIDGKTEVGMGVHLNDVVAVALGGAKCTVVAYAIDADQQLKGVWNIVGSDKLGGETATLAK